MAKFNPTTYAVRCVRCQHFQSIPCDTLREFAVEISNLIAAGWEFVLPADRFQAIQSTCLGYCPDCNPVKSETIIARTVIDNRCGTTACVNANLSSFCVTNSDDRVVMYSETQIGYEGILTSLRFHSLFIHHKGFEFFENPKSWVIETNVGRYRITTDAYSQYTEIAPGQWAQMRRFRTKVDGLRNSEFVSTDVYLALERHSDYLTNLASILFLELSKE